MSAVPHETPIRLLASGWDVSELQKQLAEHPELWNQHTHRTFAYGPHSGVDDIWVRYRTFADFDGDVAKFHNGPHESSWYPCIGDIPSAWSLARKVRRFMGADRIGGVLITRIAPGGQIMPHIDQGWHAREYEKVIVQVKGNRKQVFGFEDAELRPETGDVYWFRNDVRHWVKNESQEERISLIVCFK